jgi:uncharacterized protein (DUF2062 family)
MHTFARRHYKWLRHFPRRKHLKGGRLHRLLGEKLFAAELWKPSRQTIAGGLALGLFIGFTPTMGAQIILAGLAAYFLKVNIPMALAGSLITNPFTAAIVYPLEYQLGVRLVGVPAPSDLEGYTGMLRNFARYAKPLWIGSLVTGGITAALAYGLVTLLWKEAQHLREALHHPPKTNDASPPSPAAPVESRVPDGLPERPRRE